ncbi:hypothetical protein NJ76_08020 [Rhodococcus sp. IITR03]|nr:hypothetical protein NJ76_08020 [Rhodococcus sp. IITR03]
MVIPSCRAQLDAGVTRGPECAVRGHPADPAREQLLHRKLQRIAHGPQHLGRGLLAPTLDLRQVLLRHPDRSGDVLEAAVLIATLVAQDLP